MGTLRKPYELSVWDDVWDNTNNEFVEQKLNIIGSNNMTSQSRALSPKFVENINGTHTLTFSMYYQYKDNITGEVVQNPYIQYLTNERKLKLKYDGEWYDLIIKNVKEDSTKHTYDISASDQYINELSRNGFNLTFDAELNNNVGSIQSLATNALKDTDWIVPAVSTQGSEFIADRAKETLVELTVNTTFVATQIIDANKGVAPTFTSNQQIPKDSTIYAFYSCLSEGTPFFQFYYKSNESSPYSKDDERVITDTNCQYYVTNMEYGSSPDTNLFIPNKCNYVMISDQYRGAKYVFSADTQYNSIIGKYVKIYTRPSQNDDFPNFNQNHTYQVGDRVQYNDGQGLKRYVCTNQNVTGDWDINQWREWSDGNNIPFYGYTDLEFKAPNLLQNWVTNNEGFKSTSGWHAGTTLISGITSDDRGKIDNIAVRPASEGHAADTLLNDLKTGYYSTYVQSGKYTAKLAYTAPIGSTARTNNAIIVNTGFYDNRSAIKNISNGQKFVCRIKGSENWANKSVSLKFGTVNNDVYNFTTILTQPATFNSRDGEWYVASLIIQNSTFTERTYKKQTNGRVYIVLSGADDAIIENFEIFEWVDTGASEGLPYITPDSQLVNAKTVTTYYLYDKNTVDNLSSDSTIEDLNPAYKETVDPSTNGYTLSLSCEKRRAITIKESNYFNIIQALCETFECWAKFIIAHDSDGKITSKTVLFKNYVGSQNWAGFRYGVNLKSISRTDDSKSIVSKLIVKQNSNEFGTNGFCTIARAPSNETGETCIYNLDYYINQGLLSMSDWNAYIYGEEGYFTQLRAINNGLRSLNDIAAKQAIVLAKAKSELSVAEVGLEAAIDEFESACDAFERFASGYSFNGNWQSDKEIEKLVIDEKNIHYLIDCGEQYQAKVNFAARKDAAESNYNNLKSQYDTLMANIDNFIQSKENLYKEFYSKFYRFIQEGTWNSEEYYDDEKYYLDALSTLYTSSVPKVSYNISVLELSQLQGYEDFTFAVGDRTYVEDPEFFGYDDNGAPIREEVVLSEITYNLDAPDKNSIKVQNFKTQFQDLFKKITATVQSVQFSTGAYDKAAQLADANDTQKSTYLQGALNDASTILQNLAEQTVRLDVEGLTITDGTEQNRRLRAVSGGILLTEDGGNTWDVGITAKGINAKILTTGTLNTGAVNIMYGKEPTFRWDAYGITAYDFSTRSINGDVIYDIQPSAGVRFDRLGLYGFTGASGDWHPNAIADWIIQDNVYTLCRDDNSYKYLRTHSLFELTRDGLYLNLANMTQKHYWDGSSSWGTLDSPHIHNGTAILGRVNDLVYNKWDNNGLPYYDLNSDNAKFVKIFAVSNNEGNEELVIYDDGTLVANNVKLTGAISWTDASSPSKSVYGVSGLQKPNDNTPYSSFAKHDGDGEQNHRWHKISSNNDTHYCHTDNGGATWQGPFQITGKGADGDDGYSTATLMVYRRAATAPTGIDWSTDISYTFSTGDWSLPSGSNWSKTIPSGTDPCYVSQATALSNTGSDTILASEWSTPTLLVENGQDGNHGYNNATVYLYKRSVTKPTGAAAAPTASVTYTFSDHTLTPTSALNGWSLEIPTNTTNTLWLICASATANTATDTIAITEWSEVIQVEGINGMNGYNQAIVRLYQRASNTPNPATPSSAVIYTFSSGSVSGTLGNWSTSIPTTNGNPCYVITAAAISRNSSVSITTNQWSSPVIMVEDGTDGLNQATLYIYQRAALEPTTPPSVTYTFATGAFTEPTGWSKTIPTVDGNPCYVCSGVAIGSGTEATVEWSSPVKFVEDGSEGDDATSYWITSSHEEINVLGGKFTGQTVTFTAYSKTGTDAASSGNYYWGYHYDTGNWIDTVVSDEVPYQSIPFEGTLASNYFQYCIGIFSSSTRSNDTLLAQIIIPIKTKMPDFISKWSGETTQIDSTSVLSMQAGFGKFLANEEDTPIIDPSPNRGFIGVALGTITDATSEDNAEIFSGIIGYNSEKVATNQYITDETFRLDATNGHLIVKKGNISNWIIDKEQLYSQTKYTDRVSSYYLTDTLTPDLTLNIGDPAYGWTSTRPTVTPLKPYLFYSVKTVTQSWIAPILIESYNNICTTINQYYWSTNSSTPASTASGWSDDPRNIYNRTYGFYRQKRYPLVICLSLNQAVLNYKATTPSVQCTAQVYSCGSLVTLSEDSYTWTCDVPQCITTVTGTTVTIGNLPAGVNQVTATFTCSYNGQQYTKDFVVKKTYNNSSTSATPYTIFRSVSTHKGLNADQDITIYGMYENSKDTNNDVKLYLNDSATPLALENGAYTLEAATIRAYGNQDIWITYKKQDVIVIQQPITCIPQLAQIQTSSAQLYTRDKGVSTLYPLDEALKKTIVGLYSGQNYLKNNSPVRFFAGGSAPNNGPFMVTEDGHLYASNADISGKITTADGEIGGWSIGTETLTSGDVGLYSGSLTTGYASSDYYKDVSTTSTASYEAVRFYAGSSTPKSAPFIVTESGKLYATAGEIGGCTIDENGKLWVPEANISGTITAKKIEVKNGSNTLFLADASADSSADYSVKIAGFTINNANTADGSALYIPKTAGSALLKYSSGGGTSANPYIPDASAIYLGTRSLYDATGNNYYQIAGQIANSANDFRFVIGPNFGVMADGSLYAKNGVFGGRIIADDLATSNPNGMDLKIFHLAPVGGASSSYTQSIAFTATNLTFSQTNQTVTILGVVKINGGNYDMILPSITDNFTLTYDYSMTSGGALSNGGSSTVQFLKEVSYKYLKLNTLLSFSATVNVAISNGTVYDVKWTNLTVNGYSCKNAWLTRSNVKGIARPNGLSCDNTLFPIGGSHTLGTSDLPWSSVYAENVYATTVYGAVFN